MPAPFLRQWHTLSCTCTATYSSWAPGQRACRWPSLWQKRALPPPCWTRTPPPRWSSPRPTAARSRSPTPAWPPCSAWVRGRAWPPARLGTSAPPMCTTARWAHTAPCNCRWRTALALRPRHRCRWASSCPTTPCAARPMAWPPARQACASCQVRKCTGWPPCPRTQKSITPTLPPPARPASACAHRWWWRPTAAFLPHAASWALAPR